MKKIKSTILSVAACVLATLAFVACTDKNDWEVDPSYNRLFSITSMSVNANATDAKYTFTAIAKAEYYLIELSKDSLYDAIELGQHESSILYGDDKSITKSPVTLDNLDSDTKYFLRVKAISSTSQNSNWAYLEGYSFKTKSEQIITHVDANATNATIQWPANSKATHVVVLKGSTTEATRNLTADEIAAGEATIEDLSSETEYTIKLMNGTVTRGSIKFQTSPDYGGATVIRPGDDFQAIIANEENGNVFVVEPGTYKAGKLTITRSMSIKAAKPTDRPTVNATISLGAGVNFELKDIIMHGTELGENLKNGGHVIDFVTAGAAYQHISISGCVLSNYLKGLLYLNVAANAESVTFDDCVIYNIECDGGDFFDCRVGTPKTITFTNNTVYNSCAARDFFRIDDASSSNQGVAPTILVKNNTFNGVANNSSRRLFYIRWSGHKITYTDNIIANSPLGTLRHNSSTIIGSSSGNNYFNATTMANVDTGSKTTLDPGFADADDGDFTLSNSTLIANKVGDPRWFE